MNLSRSMQCKISITLASTTRSGASSVLEAYKSGAHRITLRKNMPECEVTTLTPTHPTNSQHTKVHAGSASLMPKDLKWIFNPFHHGISSAIPFYHRDIACYPIAYYPDNQNPLLSLSQQQQLEEMSPQDFLNAVLQFSLEMREWIMMDERQRRKTFLVNWPHGGNLSGVKMAQAGFSYIAGFDEVQCVFCRGRLHTWEINDNPMTEHAKWFPFCRFVKGIECGNIEYVSAVVSTDAFPEPVQETQPAAACTI